MHRALTHLMASSGSSKKSWQTRAKRSHAPAMVKPAHVIGLMRMPCRTVSGTRCRGKEMRGPTAMPIALEHTKAACIMLVTWTMYGHEKL